jgi:FHS family glucose/mannose:H+ symporter-like MFS transporter
VARNKIQEEFHGSRELTTRGFIFASIAFAMMGFTSTCWGTMLPWIVDHTGISISKSGLILACFTLQTLVGTFVSHFFSGRKDLIWFIRHGILVALVGFTGVVTAPTLPLLTFSACIAGLGYGTTGVALLQLINRSSNASHFRMNVASAATGFGALAGPLSIGIVGSSFIPIIVISAIGTSVVATRLLTGAHWRVERFTDSSQTRGNHMRLGMVLLAIILYSGLENSIGAWLPTIISRSQGTLEAGAKSSAFFYLFFTLGRFMGVFMAKRIESHSIILLCITATFIPLSFASLNQDKASLGLGLCGLFLGPIFPNASSWIARKTPGLPLATTATMLAIMMGGFIFPPILGFVLEGSGISGYLLSLALLLLASTSLFAYSYARWRS